MNYMTYSRARIRAVYALHGWGIHSSEIHPQRLIPRGICGLKGEPTSAPPFAVCPPTHTRVQP
eukprot:7495314-Alexandrium_andersonii.AAC.1